MSTKDEALVFLHIPKTAGSTFHMILNSRYKKNNIKNVFGSRYTDPEIKQFIDAPMDEKKSIKLLKGHMPFGLHEFIKGEAKYISVLRDPVKRVVSQYYYIKKNSYNPLYEQVETGDMSIVDFVSSGIAVGMNNGQCRFLNGDLDEYDFNGCDISLYESAISNIENKFIWLGITERFDESVLVLSKILGWEKYPYYIRENVSKINKANKAFSSEERKAIEQYNKFDIQLYDYANKMLDDEINKIDNFYEELETFKNNNKIIQRRWGWLPDKFKRFVV